MAFSGSQSEMLKPRAYEVLQIPSEMLKPRAYEVLQVPGEMLKNEGLALGF